MKKIMREILFATTNPRKIKEANATLKNYGIRVLPVALDIDEIQHHDPTSITVAKAKSAYAALSKPVVVSDTSWSITALSGFPGGYMKDVAQWFTEADWLALMARHTNKNAACLEHLAYYDGNKLTHFSYDYHCVFLESPQGQPVKNESFVRIVSLDGIKSLAEQITDEDRMEPLAHWIKFGEWFARE